MRRVSRRSGPNASRRAVARKVIRAHQLLGQALGRDLISVPAWDMLLDLYLREHPKPMSLTGLCGATRAPARTALRTIDRMVDRGLLLRSRDQADGRRVNVVMSPSAFRLLNQYFDDILALFTPV